ncbi:MAG: cation:proton antiporter [Clostridiales bacterium]|nr:cation:proton antiporter [Candidatus Equinaster intestinalis]
MMDILLSLSVALIMGLLLTRIIKPFGLPAVTGYLIAGVLIGPYGLGQIASLIGVSGLGFPTADYVSRFGVISDVALGFIAFSIGNEFRIPQLKKIGKQATVIGVFQALTATLFVDVALCVLSKILGESVFPISAAITLGAVATATAPAATLMVVRQYKAKGPLTDMLLPIVALDDAVGLIVFAVSFGIAKAMVVGAVDFISIIIDPLIEIIASLLLGLLVGYLFSQSEKFFHSRSKRLSVSVTFVVLTVAITMLKFKIGAVTVGFSPLLACMMLGTVFCNVCESSEELMDRVDRWTTPLFILFFVISGAELELSVFTKWSIIGVGAVYIIFRSIGKILGARWSSKFMKCDSTIVKHLGITLLPQAGVALGMSVSAMQLGDGVGGLVRNIVLFSVLVYELVGPLLTKRALMKAGEIIPENKVSSKVLNSPKEQAVK